MADRLIDENAVVEYWKKFVKNKIIPPKTIINRVIRFILVY